MMARRTVYDEMAQDTRNRLILHLAQFTTKFRGGPLDRWAREQIDALKDATSRERAALERLAAEMRQEDEVAAIVP